MACLLWHKWNGCKCAKCGKTRDEGHQFKPVSGKCAEKCEICSRTRALEHVWNGCTCKRCGEVRNAEHKWDSDYCSLCGAPNPNRFRIDVSNKYTAFGSVYWEGIMQYGKLSVGDTVYVYGANGRLKYQNARVSSIHKGAIPVQTIQMGDGEYAAVMLDGVRNVGDIDYGDIISREKRAFEAPTREEPPVPPKALPQARTYNDPDRKKHINMATNDIASICASGSLASKRDWVRDIGQDLFDAHGFDAMQEVFVNVKTRYPAAQSQLSSVWNGVGGWAD